MEKKESGLPDSQKGFEEALQLIEAFKEMATKVIDFGGVMPHGGRPIRFFFKRVMMGV